MERDFPDEDDLPDKDYIYSGRDRGDKKKTDAERIKIMREKREAKERRELQLLEAQLQRINPNSRNYIFPNQGNAPNPPQQGNDSVPNPFNPNGSIHGPLQAARNHSGNGKGKVIKKGSGKYQ
jgi:hypothetical protein